MDSEGTDYMADNSSEHSSTTQSPRHRPVAIEGSPLARTELLRNKSDSISTQPDTNSLTNMDMSETMATTSDTVHVCHHFAIN